MSIAISKKDYKIDYTSNTVTVSKRFYVAAQVFGSDAQKTMMEIQKLGFTVAVRKHTPGRRKPDPFTIDEAQMGLYISRLDDSEVWLPLFEAKKTESLAHRNHYGWVRSWFKETFPEFIKQPELNPDGTIRHAEMVTCTSGDSQKNPKNNIANIA